MENVVDCGFLGGVHSHFELHQQAVRFANSRTDILVSGETGTGKDTLAKCIHNLSGRTGPLIAINCAAIPESLAESQLFGVTSGAFTGVSRSRAGYIEVSDAGTLYLDEIDSMPLGLQAKLLRVLEARGIERLGSTTFVPVDLRVIASAQRSLEQLVRQGLFRRDLLFRLNSLRAHVPALRTRRACILPLFDHFAHEFATSLNREVPELDSYCVQSLLAHDWPGNVRELKSVAKRFVLGFSLLGEDAFKGGALSGLREQLKFIEKKIIEDTFRRHKDSLGSVIYELSIPRRTLYQRMKKLGM